MKTIVLTGGGTAGHCIPNLALTDELKKSFDKIIYIGGVNSLEKTLAENAGLQFYPIHTVKAERKLSIKTFTIPFKLLSSKAEAERLLKDLKPNVVFSKGGYVSLPVVLAAHSLSIPAVTHESDLTLGLANKLMAKKCEYVFTAFESTAKSVKNGVFTGNPIRQSLFEYNRATALEKYGFNGKKPILLITGGSSGSEAINNAVYKARTTLENTFDIIHITGKGKGNGINGAFYRQLDFTGEINLALNLADVVISRGGANTLFELIALQKPAVIIPLPKGNSRGDQVLNSEYFEKKGLFKILAQENLTPQSLIYNAIEVYKYRWEYIKALKAYPIKSGNKIICDKLKNLAENKKYRN